MWSFWFDCTFPWYLASCVEQRTMSPCHQCYAATVDRQMRMVAILTSSSNIALIGIWMARHPGFVVSVGYHGFIGLVQPRQRWGFFQSVCPVYGGLLRVFLCLKDKILFESTSGPSFAGMVLVDISWYSNKLPTNHWPPVTWKISKCHDLKADFHLPAGFTAFSLWNTVSHLAWGQYLKQPEEANGKEIFRQAQFFQRLLEFGAASFSVFFPVWKPLHHEHHESNPRCLLSMLEGHKAY